MTIKRLPVFFYFTLFSFLSAKSFSCGGFFCDILPINQAGEQIIFRKDGNQITTMVQIQYSGAAEDFGWVLPVPTTPELSLGSNLTITELERFTRPQFFLERTGESCDLPVSDPNSNSGGEGSFDNEDGDVDVEESIRVGPFDAQIISGTSATAINTWLTENNLDLTERGEELLEPYVAANMKFVVLKLQSNREVGDIQPIIMRYESELPMIPIRLTAIAALEDMGINVWLLGDSRAVPQNYLHVVPNYTRLNWYAGSQNAYVSYQNLITEAMDEAGGQGFATDFAGRMDNLSSFFTNSQLLVDLTMRMGVLTDAQFIRELWVSLSFLVNQMPFILPSFTDVLPLENGQTVDIYFDELSLAATYSPEQLSTASDALFEMLVSQIIEPLDNSVSLIDDELYLTRLYTTLSPSEMTVDPVFVFNADLPDQAQVRNATLDAQCTPEGTRWTLTLGEGTGRDGEQVIVGEGETPFTAPAISQEASFQIARTSESGDADILEQNNFSVAEVNLDSGASNSGGGGSFGWLAILTAGFYLASKRRKLKK